MAKRKRRLFKWMNRIFGQLTYQESTENESEIRIREGQDITSTITNSEQVGPLGPPSSNALMKANDHKDTSLPLIEKKVEKTGSEKDVVSSVKCDDSKHVNAQKKLSVKWGKFPHYKSVSSNPVDSEENAVTSGPSHLGLASVQGTEPSDSTSDKSDRGDKTKFDEKIDKIQKEYEGVVVIMRDTLDIALERGSKVSELEQKSEDLKAAAKNFKKISRRALMKFWCRRNCCCCCCC